MCEFHWCLHNILCRIMLSFPSNSNKVSTVRSSYLWARVFSLISLAPFGATDWVNGTRLRLSLSFAFRNKHEQQLILCEEAKVKFVPMLMWCGIHCCTAFWWKLNRAYVSADNELLTEELNSSNYTRIYQSTHVQHCLINKNLALRPFNIFRHIAHKAVKPSPNTLPIRN